MGVRGAALRRDTEGSEGCTRCTRVGAAKRMHLSLSACARAPYTTCATSHPSGRAGSVEKHTARP